MSVIRQSFQSLVSRYIYRCPLNSQITSYNRFKLYRFYCTSGALATPPPDGCEKAYPPKIKQIVEEISKLTLIEVADLNECLKKTLNIKDVPVSMGAMPVAAPVATEEEDTPQVTKSSFTVKLLKFDESKKVAVIKEVKSHIDGMNLVQAKKFVESAPQVVKADIAKDEAEKLKQALEAVGGICEIS